MEKVFSSFLHLTCPDCGKQILANFARPHVSRHCLCCGRQIEVPGDHHSRFRDGAAGAAGQILPLMILDPCSRKILEG